jgi:tRNA1(Val) A37 N6-methylase TrmN6
MGHKCVIKAGTDLLDDIETTDDAFLSGKLRILQPTGGYRAGLDAVLLAASVAAPAIKTTSRLLDVGSGVGTVGLCVAARLSDANVTLVERNENLVALAHKNIARNELTTRCRVVVGDVAGDAAELASNGLAPENFDHVLANPPFHDTGRGTPATNQLKSGAHAMAEDALESWARFMVRVTKPGGLVTLIHKADALPRLLQALAGRFGGLTVLPVVSQAGSVAHRVLVRGRKGSRAPFKLLSPFVVHASDIPAGQSGGGGTRFTPETEGILRHGVALDRLSMTG